MEGGSITIFRRNVFVSQCQKCPRGIFLVFHYFRVSKNVSDKSGGGGDVSDKSGGGGGPKIFRRICFV